MRIKRAITKSLEIPLSVSYARDLDGVRIIGVL